jgi:hypothetical protein
MAVGKSNIQSVALYTTGQKIGSCAQKIGFTSPPQKIRQQERSECSQTTAKRKSQSNVQTAKKQLSALTIFAINSSLKK